MNIIVINKEIFNRRPPVISTILNLSDLGYNVTLITVEINEFWLKELNSRGITVYVVPDFIKRNRFSKIIEFLRFRRLVFSILHNNGLDNYDNLLWVIGGNTIYSLGIKLKKFRFILQIQELHEQDKNYLRSFKRIINSAEKIFIPEYTRALLYKVWFGLKDVPTVLPNKPYFMPDKKALYTLENKYSSIIDKISNSKIILYQGIICKDRDLSNYIKAISKINDKYTMVLLGPDYDDMVKQYKIINPNIIHIDFIPAPDYLIFTQRAHIGILSYSPISENNIFCAPNKMFEYSAYGVPMIGNNILGLSLPIQTNNMGIIINEADPSSIIQAIETIENNYVAFSKNGKLFFDSIDNKATIAKCLESMNSKI